MNGKGKACKIPPVSDEHPASDSSGEPLLKTWDHLGLEQLKVYAREFSEHYKKERELRGRLEARNRDLELRIQELSALNAMFRQHLDRRKPMEESLNRLETAVSKVADETDLLLREVERWKTDGPGQAPAHPSA